MYQMIVDGSSISEINLLIWRITFRFIRVKYLKPLKTERKQTIPFYNSNKKSITSETESVLLS